MPENLRKLFEYIHSSDFVKIISQISNIGDLIVDEKRWGGGLHKTKKDGYLSIHKDFNVLPDSYRDDKQLLRCINLIGYITDEEQKDNSGHLEFWNENKSIASIENKFNRWVIFDTRNNFHGHPYPFKGEKPRMSVASYYYKREVIESDVWSSTEYVKLPWMEDSEEYRQKIKDRADYKKRYKKLI
jgi:Rps23 Pro-64 3,4-dihydroxylase Tpa1-like proline 4-hydroxylase